MVPPPLSPVTAAAGAAGAAGAAVWQLQSMFPAFAHEVLDAALARSRGDLAAAVDEMLAAEPQKRSKREDPLQHLLDMGFNRARAKAAFNQSKGSIEDAITVLLQGDPFSDPFSDDDDDAVVEVPGPSAAVFVRPSSTTAVSSSSSSSFAVASADAAATDAPRIPLPAAAAPAAQTPDHPPPRGTTKAPRPPKNPPVKRAPKPKQKPKPPPKPRSSSGPPPAQASPVEDPSHKVELAVNHKAVQFALAQRSDGAARPRLADITNVTIPSANHGRDVPTCIVCLEDDHRDGILCADKHFVCRACLDPLVGAHVEKPLAERKVDHGHIRCPEPGCPRCLEPQAIAGEVSKACFDTFLRGLSEVTEKMARDKLLEEQEEERLRQQGDVLGQYRRHLVDNILTLACPRCHQAFVDFDNCLSLSCSGCRASFCGYCLVDCGKDAHAHVAVCPEGLEHRAGGWYLALPVWQKLQQRRKLRLANEYLLTLPADVRAQVRQACLQELRELEQ